MHLIGTKKRDKHAEGLSLQLWTSAHSCAPVIVVWKILTGVLFHISQDVQQVSDSSLLLTSIFPYCCWTTSVVGLIFVREKDVL